MMIRATRRTKLIHVLIFVSWSCSTVESFSAVTPRGHIANIDATRNDAGTTRKQDFLSRRMLTTKSKLPHRIQSLGNLRIKQSNENLNLLRIYAKHVASSKSLRTVMHASFRGASLAIKESWWCLPMLLVAFPVYSAVFEGTYATMPSWWAFEHLGYLKDMPALCTTFLISNIFYFISGLFLLDRFPWPSSTRSSDSRDTVETPTLTKRNWSGHTAQYPLLGMLVLTSGIISSVYHACQALGDTKLAETLCFVDHGVALSSGLYFFRKCGVPSIKTLAIGIPSLAFLAFPGDMYPLIHSLWHMGSSGAIVSWALDGVDKRKRSISTT